MFMGFILCRSRYFLAFINHLLTFCFTRVIYVQNESHYVALWLYFDYVIGNYIMSIENFNLKFTKKIYNASKKFDQDDKYISDLKPVCRVFWLDQDKIGYYDDGGYTDSPLWDQADVKEFKDLNRAVAFAQSKYNGDNIVDVDIDIFLPLITRIELDRHNTFFGSFIPTFYPDSAQLVCIGVIHAYDIDLTVAHKEAYHMFRENYKLMQNKEFAYES